MRRFPGNACAQPQLQSGASSRLHYCIAFTGWATRLGCFEIPADGDWTDQDVHIMPLLGSLSDNTSKGALDWFPTPHQAHSVWWWHWGKSLVLYWFYGWYPAFPTTKCVALTHIPDFNAWLSCTGIWMSLTTFAWRLLPPCAGIFLSSITASLLWRMYLELGMWFNDPIFKRFIWKTYQTCLQTLSTPTTLSGF